MNIQINAYIMKYIYYIMLLLILTVSVRMSIHVWGIIIASIYT